MTHDKICPDMARCKRREMKMFLQPDALNAHALLSGSTLPAARSWPRNLELRRQLLASGADLREKTELQS